MPKRLTALGIAFRRFAVPGRVGARVFGLNIGCRYSTPVCKRPLHPTRSQFKPEASQTQAPVTPRDRAGATRRWELNNKPGTHVECVLFVMAGELRLTFDDTELHGIRPSPGRLWKPMWHAGQARWPFLIRMRRPIAESGGATSASRFPSSCEPEQPSSATDGALSARSHGVDTPPEPVSDARRVSGVTPEDEPWCCPAGTRAAQRRSEQSSALIVAVPGKLAARSSRVTPAIPRGGYAGSFQVDMITVNESRARRGGPE